MAVEIKSYNQFLGNMIRKVIADTPLNDINTNSVLLALLEAAAQNDFENNVAILNLLELLEIDALKNNDLDNRAGDFGLSRTPAIKATGFVTISDSNITKRSTGLFPVKPPPISGSTKIFVIDASGWANSGTLFIGRGTTNFEGPISYSNITDNGTFYTIDLVSALQKDHLASETVVDGQGTTDRLITAGTTVAIPANNQHPQIEYITLRDAVIPAGEDKIGNIDIIARIAGTNGNAGINTIVQFNTVPFPGATVSNTTALTSGQDIETDDELRNRLKSYAQTLARGTKQSILEAIVGVFDSTDNKQVTSAVITEPVSVGDPSIVYIDDGSGFQPSFAGQSVDRLLSEATGNEEFLQLANYPLPRPQVINTADGPYELINGMQFRVIVDDTEETVTFATASFSNISAATLPEIVTTVNDQAKLFKLRLTSTSSRLLVYPVAHDAEIIQVSPQKDTDDASLFANNIFKFPTNEFSHIALYQNDKLLKEKEKAATLSTTAFSNWNVTSNSNLIISIDNTPAQNRTFTTTDFGGTAFAALSLSDWATAFNNKYAGLTATALSSGQLKLESNKTGSGSSLKIIGGTLLPKLFPDLPTSDTGQTSDFELNRQNGNIRIKTTIAADDDISAGVENAKGSVISEVTSTGSYNLSTDTNGREAALVIVADAETVAPRIINLPAGSSITISDQGSSVMRIMANTLAAFKNVIASTHDYIYIAKRSTAGWVDEKNTGLYKVIRKGEHTTAGTDTYIEVLNDTIVAGTHSILAPEDVQAFYADAYPQIWKGSYLTNPAVATIQNIIDSVEKHVENVLVTTFKTNKVKITSSTEDNGSIAVPVSIGNATLLYKTGGSHQEGNQSHIANRVPETSAITTFKRTTPNKTNVWLDRYTYTDIKGPLASNAVPGIEGVDAFSDIVESTGVLTDANIEHDDILAFTAGNNHGQFRSIRQILSGDKVGTQHNIPKTIFDHIVNDEIQLQRSLQFSSSDSIVVILDNDSVNKTIDIPLARTGRVNSGSQANSFLPTDLALSANDADNEPGVDFGTPQVWSKELNNTEFKDYRFWMRAHNWYSTGGATSGLGGQMIVRSAQYGPAGEKMRFKLEYPSKNNESPVTTIANTPSSSEFTYFFGSSDQRATGITGGTTIDVTDLGSSNFRYTFSAGVSLADVQIGDIFSALADSGISDSNRGQYRINAVDVPSRTLDIYNPDGSPTTAAASEVTDITCVADVVGSAAVNTVATVADVSASLDQKYFILYDTNGSVAFWYDVDNSGSGEPTHGATRSVRIYTVLSNDTANDVASKTTTAINSDPEFSATVATNNITVTNLTNGVLTAGNAGNSGFTVNQTSPGTNDNSLDGKYFIIQDAAGSVAVWFDVGATGTLEPIHGAQRSIKINTVVAGDGSTTVAGRVNAALITDSAFTSGIAGSTVTATDVATGNRPAPNAGTSGFTLTTQTNGSSGVQETVAVGSSVRIFPLANTTVADIASKVNESDVVKIAAVGDSGLDIKLATREERYTPTPGAFTTSLAYDHDPSPTSGKNKYISLHDGETWIMDFYNTNPNFVFKKALKLVGAAPSVYVMDTAPNHDSTDTGEFFKLIPTTIQNLEHHLTQKALSQLPIISDIDIATSVKSVQIKSKELGSAGAIEVVGGRANNISFELISDSEKVSEGSNDFMTVKIKSFPETIQPGDTVQLQNPAGVKRLSRLNSKDTIDVVKVGDEDYEYRFNAKETFFVSDLIKFTIADSSSSYGRPAGTVWRWTHSDSGSMFTIEDKTQGTPATQPNDEIAAGGTDAAALKRYVTEAGSATTKAKFSLSVDQLPTQADYFTFTSADGNTFAVWFDINAAGTAPNGFSYTAATHKIEVDILSTDTPNQVVSKLSTTLNGNTAFNTSYAGQQISGATLSNVAPGDLLYAFGSLPGWSAGNKVSSSGDDKISGLPIIGVDSSNRYIDVVNHNGEAMSETIVDSASTVHITPAPIIEWKLGHVAKLKISQVVVSGGVATLTTDGAHNLKVPEVFKLENNTAVPTFPGAGFGTVVSVPAFNQITYATSAADGTYSGGTVIKNGVAVTRYKIERLDINNLIRLSYVDGQAPKFADSGVAVDDLITLSGSTFESNNNGAFKVRAVDNTSIIYENKNAKEQVSTDNVPFNDRGLQANWTQNLATVTGVAGTFANLSIGDSVKKAEDEETLWVQVLTFDTGVAATATSITLNAEYQGSTSTSPGVSFDQKNDVGKGVYLDNIEDIRIYEGDSARSGDTIFVSSIVNNDWFNPNNTGTKEIKNVGTSSDYKPLLRVKNSVGVAETNRKLSVDDDGVFITENNDHKFDSYKIVEHISIDEFDENRRIAYLTPADRTYKFSESNKTSLVHVGKIGFSNDVTTGIDGYLYYTGLLQTVQRIIDGFEPDQDSYPGRRAVGGAIEVLPSLITRVSITIDITTNEGVNVGEISNEIKSVIINYVNNLGVGGDVILSEITARVMQVRGVGAMTFTKPVPTTERIAIDDVEKAFIEAKDIAIS